MIARRILSILLTSSAGNRAKWARIEILLLNAVEECLSIVNFFAWIINGTANEILVRLAQLLVKSAHEDFLFAWNTAPHFEVAVAIGIISRQMNWGRVKPISWEGGWPIYPG